MTLYAQQLDGSQMAESYSAGASDGLMDGVDLQAHVGVSTSGGTPSSTSNPNVNKVAWGIVVGSLALLWILGAGPFRNARA